MSVNATILKRCMKTLSLTGKGLATMISTYRDDGKVTAPETVSRWLSGTNPADPAVVGWLHELLRAKALGLNAAIIQWPQSKSIVIGVTNLKGGVGTTTVSHNLAAVSAYDYRLRTKHISVGDRGDTEYAVEDLKRRGIPAEMMSFDEMLGHARSEYEVVIVDVARDAAYEAMGNRPEAFLRQFAPDLLLVPADFGDGFEARSTRQFADIDGLRSRLCFLHRPRFMSINFFAVARDAGFDVLANEFCPLFIPQTIAGSSHMPQRPFGEWQSEDQHQRHIELFNYLVEEIGGEITLPSETPRSIRDMDIDTLINYIEQWAK